jgi:opacity protein-like surface antigen
MKPVFFLLLVIPFVAHSQKEKDPPPVDSSWYYQKELGKLWKETIDSLQQSEKYITLQQNAKRLMRKSNDYAGFVLFGDIMHSDYSSFNALLKLDGFPGLKPMSGRLGFGVSQKLQHLMIDTYFMTFGINSKTTKGDAEVKTLLSNALQFNLGYDVLNSERISIYPFAGLALRFSEIKYKRSSQPNPNYTSIENMRSDENEVKLASTRIGYQYGVGFDYAVAYNTDKLYKTILFIKAGVNQPFKKDIYKSDDIPNYRPGIKQGDWLITIGFKFANKN